MNADLLMFMGVFIGAFAFPTLVSSFSAGRPPTMSIVFAFIGGALIVTAIMMTPGGYEFNELPGLMVRVVRDAFS